MKNLIVDVTGGIVILGPLIAICALHWRKPWLFSSFGRCALMKLSFLSETASPLRAGTPSQNFASLIPPTASQRVPPVHETTGGHGSA